MAVDKVDALGTKDTTEIVWLVGGCKGSAFCDVYRTEEAAKAAVMKYLEDEFWIQKVPKRFRSTLTLIMKNGTVDEAIGYYNEHVDREYAWEVSSEKVRD